MLHSGAVLGSKKREAQQQVFSCRREWRGNKDSHKGSSWMRLTVRELKRCLWVMKKRRYYTAKRSVSQVLSMFASLWSRWITTSRGPLYRRTSASPPSWRHGFDFQTDSGQNCPLFSWFWQNLTGILGIKKQFQLPGRCAGWTDLKRGR